MPELPEVETVKRGLLGVLPGRIIATVSVDTPKVFHYPTEATRKYLIGAKIIGVERRAKQLIIGLDTGYSLVIHLKMTGQLVYRGSERFGAGHPSASLVGNLPDRSTRVIVVFKDKTKLFFNDQRKFGWIKLVDSNLLTDKGLFEKLGPEPLESSFTSEDLRHCLLRRPKSTIKAVLLDQSIIAGVGNIYADESLWAARIHPATKVALLSAYKIKSLHRELRNILLIAIEKGGSTDRNYVDALGRKGSYLSFARVFRREGQPCLRCNNKIVKIRVAGRGTHICPHCQKLLS